MFIITFRNVIIHFHYKNINIYACIEVWNVDFSLNTFFCSIRYKNMINSIDLFNIKKLYYIYIYGLNLN